jgi:hypothetical protein
MEDIEAAQGSSIFGLFVVGSEIADDESWMNAHELLHPGTPYAAHIMQNVPGEGQFLVNMAEVWYDRLLAQKDAIRRSENGTRYRVFALRDVAPV